MFARPLPSHGTCSIQRHRLVPQRRFCQLESRPDDAACRIDDDGGTSETPSTRLPGVLTRRGRASRGKLKKSKRMEALSAALASKSRSTDPPSLIPDNSAPVFPRETGTDSDEELRAAAMDESDEVTIPYDSARHTEHYENDPEDLCVLPKPIYIISDCTGESAARTVKAALRQFESSIRAHCPTSLILHRFVMDEKKICELVEAAAKEDALVVFTLVDPELVTVIQTACALFEVKCVDLWSNLLNIMENHLDALRSVLPMNHPNRESIGALDPEYFKRIEAVEFTRKMDDGAHPERWYQADILLLGVSRSGKTPLSIYLGQRGYKVANLPLVKDLEIPSELNEIDQSKIFALTIDPRHLFKIRRSRMGSMGVGNGRSMYADLKGVLEELDYAHGLYKRNPLWPILDVTTSGVEETAAKIQRILSDRDGFSEQVIFA